MDAVAQNVEAVTEARIYWVALSGNDANDGSRDLPFATIQRAIDQAKPGTTIHVGPGTFYERISFTKPGEDGQPITLRGSTEGDKKSTRIEGGRKVDPAVWQPAPEVAPAVFKTTAFKEEPEFITIDGLSLARLNRVAGSVAEDGARKFTAMEVLSWPDGPVAQAPVAGVDVWTALGGAYTYDNGTTYVRLKGGDDPRKHTFAITPTGPVVSIETAHITLRDLEIGGGEVGIAIQGLQASHNRIEHCRVVNGRIRIKVSDRASHTVIAHNYLSMGFLGKKPGPWTISSSSPVSDELKTRRFLYRYFKTFASEARTSDDKSLQLNEGASDTLIEDNDLDGGIIGIEVREVSKLTIKDNRIQNFSSVGMALRAGASNVHIANNEIRDCNISIRLHEMNSYSGHELYIYGNRCVQPPLVGMQLFSHFFAESAITGKASPPIPNVAYVYHNTFVGGSRGVTISPKTLKNFPQLVILNNIFAGQETPLDFKTIVANEPSIIFAHNWIFGTAPGQEKPGWLAASNIVATPGAAMMDGSFVLTGENAGKETGLDVSKPFGIGKKTFGPLPGFQPSYFSGAKPDLGAMRTPQTN